jgi:hypothetical protein
MSENLHELLLNELRDAVAARIADDADRSRIIAELTWRLGRIRWMQGETRWHPGRPEGEPDPDKVRAGPTLSPG